MKPKIRKCMVGWLLIQGNRAMVFRCCSDAFQGAYDPQYANEHNIGWLQFEVPANRPVQ